MSASLPYRPHGMTDPENDAGDLGDNEDEEEEEDVDETVRVFPSPDGMSSNKI